MRTADVELLRDHHLTHAVVDVVAGAEQFATLVSAYLDPWPDLERAIRSALERGVDVRIISRAPDAASHAHERERAAAARSAFERLGVEMHTVERLHAKLYVNESQAVLASMNLVKASRDSIELGLRTTDAGLHGECMEFIASLGWKPEAPSETPGAAPPASPVKAASTTPPAKDAPRRRKRGLGFCIGCASSALDFDPSHPFCKDCYAASRRGTAPGGLPHRVCHSCGEDNSGTLERPVCKPCYAALNRESPAPRASRAPRRSGGSRERW